MADFDVSAELKRVQALGNPEKQWTALDAIRDGSAMQGNAHMLEVLGGMSQDEVNKIARAADASSNKTFLGALNNYSGQVADGVGQGLIEILTFNNLKLNEMAARMDAPLDDQRRERILAGYNKMTEAYKHDPAYRVGHYAGDVGGFVSGGQILTAVKWGRLGFGAARLENLGALKKVGTFLGYGEKVEKSEALWRRALTKDFWKGLAKGATRWGISETAFSGASMVLSPADAGENGPSEAAANDAAYNDTSHVAAVPAVLDKAKVDAIGHDEPSSNAVPAPTGESRARAGRLRSMQGTVPDQDLGDAFPHNATTNNAKIAQNSSTTRESIKPVPFAVP